MFKFLFKIFKWPAVVLLLLGGAAWFYPEKFLTVDSGPAVADVIIVIGAPATTKRTPPAKWPRQSSDGDCSANTGLLPLPMRGRFRHRRSAASPFHPGSLVDSRAESILRQARAGPSE